jgi:diguanylate cyclase (GGDEF)-like protein
MLSTASRADSKAMPPNRAGPGDRPRHSPSAGILVFVALIAIVGFVCFVYLVLAQVDRAHLIEASSAQRLRTQRIAFLALAAQTGRTGPDWRSELDSTVDELLTAAPPAATGDTAVGRAIVRYARAARSLEINRRDEGSLGYIAANRKPLLAALDADVKDQFGVLHAHVEAVLVGLGVGLVCMLGIMVLAWTRILSPYERLTAELIGRLNRTNDRLRSLLSMNSDGSVATDAKHIDMALELVLKAFNMQFAYVGKFERDAIRMEHVVGEPVVNVGDVVKLSEAYIQKGIPFGSVLTVDDLAVTNVAEGVQRYPGWHGYIAAPLFIEGNEYGAIGFLSRNVVAFNEFDRDFIQLVAMLVSSALERQIQREHLDQLAFYDALTGLANRAKLMQDLRAAISLGGRHERPFALHYIDLDGFKGINDTLGHGTGDLVLAEAASRLKVTARSYDIAARLGGDEFVVLQAEVLQISEAEALGQRLLNVLSKPYVVGNQTLTLGASIGIALFPDHGDEPSQLLHSADVALYRAKANGKNRIEVASAVSAERAVRATTASDQRR